MYDLHAYARARQIEMDRDIAGARHAAEARRLNDPRSRGKLVRLVLGESPQSRAA